jgi:hypothetical protein
VWTPDYFVRYITLPPKVPAAVVCNNDGTFDIYINELLSDAQREKALKHEIDHIKEDHFYSDQPIGELEAHANAASVGKAYKMQKAVPAAANVQKVKTIPHYTTLRGLTLGELNAAQTLLVYGEGKDTAKLRAAFIRALSSTKPLVVR